MATRPSGSGVEEKKTRNISGATGPKMNHFGASQDVFFLRRQRSKQFWKPDPLVARPSKAVSSKTSKNRWYGRTHGPPKTVTGRVPFFHVETDLFTGGGHLRKSTFASKNVPPRIRKAASPKEEVDCKEQRVKRSSIDFTSTRLARNVLEVSTGRQRCS